MEALRGFDLYLRVYTGAVFLHMGRTFLIDRLDVPLGVALARPVGNDLSYYTKARDRTTARQLHPKGAPGFPTIGTCDVVMCIFGHHRISRRTGTVIESFECPPREFVLPTSALWFTITEAAAADGGLTDVLVGLHGAMHAVMAIAPLYAEADHSAFGGIAKWDARSHSYYFLVHDRVAGGSGVPETLRSLFPHVLREALRIVTACRCQNGCPQCMFSAHCACYNKELSKAATVAVFEYIAATLLT